MRHAIVIPLLSAAVALLSACGQMGPLYMPPPEQAQPAVTAEPDHSEQDSSGAP